MSVSGGLFRLCNRGWLLRLLRPVRDQDDFSRLDKQLVASLEQAGVDTSQPPLTDLQQPCAYAQQQQQLECALKQFGGIERLLRDSLSATLRLQSLMNHLPSGSNIEALLQQEIEYYQSSSLPLLERDGSMAGADAFLRAGSGSSNGGSGSLPKVNGGLATIGSGGGGSSSASRLRRTSSSAGRPLKGGAAVQAAEPYMVLRNDTVRSEWRVVFNNKERVLWKDFWHKMVQPQVRGHGLAKTGSAGGSGKDRERRRDCA